MLSGVCSLISHMLEFKGCYLLIFSVFSTVQCMKVDRYEISMPNVRPNRVSNRYFLPNDDCVKREREYKCKGPLHNDQQSNRLDLHRVIGPFTIFLNI